LIPVENLVGQGFFDAKEMADVFDRMACKIEDWDASF